MRARTSASFLGCIPQCPTRMFFYTAYGLRIRSELAVPEFVPADEEAYPDVRVRFGRVDRRPSDPEGAHGCFHATPDEAYLFWKTHGAYVVRDGREIVVEPSTDPHRVPRLPLLGVALGILLFQRGLLTFHASAVSVDGGAAAFVGAKGAGKSTLAAALHARGHPLMTDDVLAATFSAGPSRAGRPYVAPGFPRFKLWPNAVVAVGRDPEDFPRLHPQLEKRGVDAARGFSLEAVPLRGVYALADGPAVRARPLPPQEAFAELMGHAYAQRFLGSTGTTPAHFRRCMKLLGAVPMFRLERPRSLSALSELAQFVEEHARSTRDENLLPLE